MRTVSAAAAAGAFVFPQPFHREEHCRGHCDENENVENIHVFFFVLIHNEEDGFFRLSSDSFETILIFYKIVPMRRTINAMTQATKHCHTTTDTAQLPPSSRLIAATAATQGV